MKKTLFILFIAITTLLLSCNEQDKKELTAQQIVDKSIVICGGERYPKSTISFQFRDRKYVKEHVGGQKILKRIFKNDSLGNVDVKTPNGFERYVDGTLVKIPDSVAHAYANSINSVHYFAYLPYGLNDPAVRKEYLGKIMIHDQAYYKIKVTFDQENGGDDFDDVYLYWFNTKTLKPDFLAYEFHVNGGGLRFREAYNERYVNGIRFVDYKNYKPKANSGSVYKIDKLYVKGELELLSTIDLRQIEVTRDNYN
ncbi:MAG: DUF6503 family protein [Maribacter sp.]|uniref:DUF6503 family protein n=1 Tax=Maribacter sp. TaxID=1897614 RepID=UPI003C725CC9